MLYLSANQSVYRSDRPGYHGTSIDEAFAKFPDDESCMDYILARRFGPDPVCPRCGRTGRWRRHAWHKHYFHPCGGILSPMAGTAFDRSRVPLRLWFYAFLHFANSAEGISVPFLARELGVSEPTAFRMASRIRLHLAALDDPKGIGGKHQPVTVNVYTVLRIVNKRRNARNVAHAFVLADAQRVCAFVVRHLKARKLHAAIAQKVLPGSRCVTDCQWTRSLLSSYGNQRPNVDFQSPEALTSCNPDISAAGFMQYMRLAYKDQFRGISIENSWLYFKEFEFRYNRRIRSQETYWDILAEFPRLTSTTEQRLRSRNLLWSPEEDEM